MKQYFYPAIFHAAEEGGFWVSFPDLPECLTEGDTMEEAYAMAVKALGLSLTDRLHDQEELPQPLLPVRFLWKIRTDISSWSRSIWRNIRKTYNPVDHLPPSII